MLEPVRAPAAAAIPPDRCLDRKRSANLLIWDHLGTLHRAIADYGLDEVRLIRRCYVMAAKVFNPEFVRPARELAREAAKEGP